MMMDTLDITIIAPAFAAGAIVLLTHVPLGLEVLKRGIIFIDLAVAQIAGLGVIIAYTLGHGEQGVEAQVAAVGSALLGAWILSSLDRRYAQFQEAIIGISFVLAATAGIVLLANNPHGGEHLREMLVGQILWVQWTQLIPAAIVSLAVFVTWVWFAKRLGALGFYSLFAVAVTLSVQLVGVYLVFASLIIPALAVRMVGSGAERLVAGVIGLTGYASGLLASALFDLPGGAVIVWSIALVAFLFILVGRALKR